MVVAVALAGFALAAGQLALVFWLFRRLSGFTDRMLEKSEDLGKARSRIDELSRAVDDRDQAIAKVAEERDRELAARRVAEKHRDVLLESVATGNPAAVAAGLRAELSALSALSRATAREGDRDTDEVHGGAPRDPHR